MLLHSTCTALRTRSGSGVQPEEHRTQEALEALVVSAQFRAQLDVFGTALQSGQLELAQFGLQAEARVHHCLASTVVVVHGPASKNCFLRVPYTCAIASSLVHMRWLRAWCWLACRATAWRPF